MRLRYTVTPACLGNRIRATMKGAKMAEKDLEKAFLEAAEIAKKLPKNLQEAGFTRAVEELLRKSPSAGAGGGRSDRTSRRRRNTATDRGSSDTEALMNAIDRTAYPDMDATERVADRALKVLHLVYHDHGTDGLTAAKIAAILSTKFRLPATASAVKMALVREKSTVDIRAGSDRSRVFHIMAPGEAYLEKLRSGEESGPPLNPKKNRARKKAIAHSANTKRKAASTIVTVKKATSKKARGRPGPKAVVSQLLESGFFRTTRTISDVQKELKHRRGHSYTVQELSPALVRSIRDKDVSLKRERNDAGQYEYSQASSYTRRRAGRNLVSFPRSHVEGIQWPQDSVPGWEL